MSNLRLTTKKGARLGSTRARCNSAILKLESNYRFGMTLIELLIVIVILTTLVVAVVPILSPNNDARKIREASRGLHTYITLAQAKAARSGRPVGIAFRESSSDSGVAIEVFQLEVPKGFAGFSEDSRCTIDSGIGQYGSAGNGGVRFIDQYDGAQLSGMRFITADGMEDPFPPRMFRIGDMVDVEGNQFLIVDDGDDASQPNRIDDSVDAAYEYLLPDTTATPTQTVCIWVNNTGQLISSGLKTYRIFRQPVNSSESPFQLPAGVAIDMQGSVIEGGVTTSFPVPNSLATTGSDTVGIMFSPTGAVSDVFFNGSTITNVAKLMLLLGRVENGGLQTTSEYTLTGLTNDQLEERQEKINWLNLDSRWLAIAARSGRVVVSENAFVTEAMITTAGGNPDSSEDQIEAAHEFIHSMKRGGGR